MRLTGYAVIFLLICLMRPDSAAASDASQSRIEAALTNIMTLKRPGQDGLAIIWDGNKYVQCRQMHDRTLRCEAAGALMQTSLGRVLTLERRARLSVLGWNLDSSFGNYVQSFPPGLPPAQIAGSILQALKEGYDVDVATLRVTSNWVKSVPCPPRVGPSQNLAGSINDHPAMASVAVRDCVYRPGHEPSDKLRPRGRTPSTRVSAREDLIKLHAPRVSGEIQRLRVNMERRVYFSLSTGTGYVQCAPAPPREIYCEAQSADSWSALARILTPERVARLRAVGFADPGRSPNYWKSYSIGDSGDGAIADELLTILHDIYGYTGAPALKFKSERDR